MNASPSLREHPIRNVFFALFCTLFIYLVAILHPYSTPAETSSPFPISAVHGWVFIQAFVIVSPGLLLGFLVSFKSARLGLAIGHFLMGASVCIYLFDLLTFVMIGERFLSTATIRISTDLAPSLLMFLTKRMILYWVLAASGLAAVLVSFKIASRSLARRAANDSRRSSPHHIGIACATLLAIPCVLPMLHGPRTLDWMKQRSDRHPLFALSLLSHYDRGLPPPVGQDRMESSLVALSVSDRIEVVTNGYPDMQPISTPEVLPDILLVVIESLRHEALNPISMPNLYNASQAGIWCRNHFSTSNSTNMGMFSMLYGLDSVWFERALHWKPALLSILKQAGYRTAFFGGSEGWREFKMDTFVNASLYDEFFLLPFDYTVTDKEMCLRTQAYFERGSEHAPGPTPFMRQPRFAVLYLYSTHFDYRSEDVDRIHTPFVKGTLDGAYSASDRDRVWNRYLNSAHFVDRVLGPLLAKDRLVVVAGDHGEAFLEDECRIHGIRISKVQNMTPAVIVGPHINASVKHNLTSHTDILPTVLDAIGIKVANAGLLEGSSLVQDQPARYIATRNYMSDEIAIIADLQDQADGLFGYRSYFSLLNWQAAPANPINEKGLAWSNRLEANDDRARITKSVFLDWLAYRFGADPRQDTRSVGEALEDHLQSSQPDVLLQAIKLAGDMDSATSVQLLAQISGLCSHPEKTVREAAKRALIVIQRRSSR